MQRPVAVTVIGILNIVFGTCALFCLPFAVIGFLATRAIGQNAILDLMDQVPFYKFWSIGMSGMGILVGIALIIAGILLLMMKDMGRLITIGYGFYGVTVSLVNLLVNLIFASGPLMAQMNQSTGPEAAGGAIGGVIGMGCSFFLGLLYPIAVLFFLTRPAVVEAFKSRA